MKMVEFDSFALVKDADNPLINLYKLTTGELFYVEPLFYTHLTGFKDRVENQYQRIINEMLRVVKVNKKVIFTGNFENPQVIKDDFIYQEIEDITNPLQIFVEDKSRGSDYGD